MKIALGNDHSAIEVRQAILKDLNAQGHEVIDFGTSSYSSVDYTDYAEKVAKAVINKDADKGVLICGTGIGMSIAANRFPEIRCALCADLYSAEQSRAHNDANVLALRARNQDINLNREILRVWLKTPFSGEPRHVERIKKLGSINTIK